MGLPAAQLGLSDMLPFDAVITFNTRSTGLYTPDDHVDIINRKSVHHRSSIIGKPRPERPENWMRFHLTYEGLLLGSGRADPRPDHKHDIRRVFHHQLKRLWDTTWLSEMKHGSYVNAPDINPDLPMREGLAQRCTLGSYSFVPLVREELALLCSLKILFLRPDLPGSLIQSADLDSRLKTLFDALKMPTENSQLGKYQTPNSDEVSLYCLLEDDKLISQVSVETDALLQPTSPGLTGNYAKNDARLIIDVTVRPYSLTYGNIGFGA